MVNKKNFGSVFVIIFLVISLAVVLFFAYGLMTGNVVYTDSTAVWASDKVLGDNDVYEFIFPSGVSLTSVSVSWFDNDGKCNGFIERNTSSGWQNITTKPEVSNTLSVFTFNNINIADKEFRVKVEGCESKKMNITNVEAVFGTTKWSCFNYTYSKWSSTCNTAGNRTRTVSSKVLSSCDIGFPTPDLTQKCCLNYTYNQTWSSCNSTGQKIKNNISQNFMVCSDTNPNQIIIENCLCNNTNWNNSANTSCMGGFKNVTWTKVGNCTEGVQKSIDINVDCVENIADTCNAPLFCNTSSVANSVRVPGTCASGTCSNCTNGYGWNGSSCLSKCVSNPGCLLVDSLADAANVSGYCSTGKCFECGSNFIFNNSKCELRQCESSVGCLNLTSLANANNLTRNCSVGKICFACNSGYNWNNASCVFGAGAWVNKTLTDAEFLAGTMKTMQVYDRVYFAVGSTSYWMGLLSVNETIYTADVQIGSIVNKTLVINSEAKVDLNGDSIADVSILLEDVYGGEADISIKKIVSTAGQSGTPIDNSATINVNQDESASSADNTGASGAGTQAEGPGVLVWVIIGLVILIIMVVVAIYFKLRKSEPPRAKPFFVPTEVSQSTAQFRPVNQSTIPISRPQIIGKSVAPPVSNNDFQVVSEIRKQLVGGNQFISAGNFSSAKEVYSRISQMYKKLTSSNSTLYSEIVEFYNKIPK